MIDFDRLMKKMQENRHTIHCLVSPLVANEMANVLLSLGQSPFMAEYYKEVYEVSKNSDGLLVNMATINESKLAGINQALKSAKENLIPICLDPVGASATKVRLDSCLYYLDKYPINILKGNFSEIYSLYHQKITTKGVDSKDISLSQMIDICQKLATKYDLLVAATGKTDIICDKDQTIILKNGDEMLTKITGTGCLLGGLMAATSSFEMSLDALALAISILNISAELACKDKGMASFKLSLMDEISLMTSKKIKENIRYERI